MVVHNSNNFTMNKPFNLNFSAYIEDVPYQISLRVLNETTQIWSHTCGGIIINLDTILNAAHCVT